MLRKGTDVILFAYGSTVPPAMEAAATLAARGIDCGVINARFVKPLDIELIEQALDLAPRLLTVEEHLISGGLGSAVMEAVAQRRLDPAAIRVHAIPDQFIEHGPQAYQRAKFRLDADGIVETVLELYPELTQSPAKSRERAGRRPATQKETVTW